MRDRSVSLTQPNSAAPEPTPTWPTAPATPAPSSFDSAASPDPAATPPSSNFDPSTLSATSTPSSDPTATPAPADPLIGSTPPQPDAAPPETSPDPTSSPITPPADQYFAAPAAAPPTYTPPPTAEPSATEPPQPEQTDTGFSWSNPPSGNQPGPSAETPSISTQDLYGTSNPTEPNAAETNLSAPNPEPIPPTTDPDPIQTEPAPTDLSHLAGPSAETQPGVYTPPLSQPETLVAAASNGTGEAPNIPESSGHKGIPKWLIGVGAGLLIAVMAASAYFILGIGKSSPKPESTPANSEERTLTSPPTPPPSPAVVIPTATPSALPDQSQATTPPTASSAADLLRARQGR